MRIASRLNTFALCAATLSVAVMACKSDRPREPEPVTTTGAEVNHDPLNPQGALVPIQGRASQEGTAPDESSLVELADGGKVEVRSLPESSGPSSGMNIPGNGTRDTVSDIRKENESNAAAPHDGTQQDEADRSSFERSGGTSGLGIYGQKVPAQERFDTKPAPRSPKDGGK